MKYLFLIRHAQAEALEHASSDFQRGLTKQGENEATWVGQNLHQLKTVVDTVITSTAQRAQATAHCLAKELHLSPQQLQSKPELYQANPKQLLTVLQTLPEKLQTVILVAHNPGISLLAQTLAADNLGNLPTCGVCHIELPIDSWLELDLQTPGRLCQLFFPPANKG